MNQVEIQYRHGFPESDRMAAAVLFDEAFGAKFGLAISSKEQRLEFLAATFDPSFAFCVYDQDQLVGLAGYHTPDGSLTGEITYDSLTEHLGFLRGSWAALVLSLYEHKLRKGVLHMDGIVVSAQVRGRGIGSALLRLLGEFAASKGYSAVQLEVIGDNPRARKLYESCGFVVTRTQHFEYLRFLLGFGSSSTMELKI